MNAVLVKQARPLPKALSRSSRKPGVLVVDDEEGMRGVLNVWLRHEGCSVWLAESGSEAIELYELHRDTIDLVLLDVIMPGMSGPETLSALQELNPQVRCSFMSCDYSHCTEAIFQEMGADDILHKPFWLAAVSELLGKLSTPPERQQVNEDERRSEDGSHGSVAVRPAAAQLRQPLTA
jgi:DNA-binding NtrC family response regulator